MADTPGSTIRLALSTAIAILQGWHSLDIFPRPRRCRSICKHRVGYLDLTTRSANFDNKALYVGYDVAGRDTKINVKLGTSRISRSGANDNGALLQLTLSRNISARSTLSLGLGQEFTDAANTFGSANVFTSVSLDTQSLGTTSSPYKHTYGSLGWDAAGIRTLLGASLSFNREKYLLTTAADRDVALGELHLARQLTARTSLRLQGSYTDSKFKNVVGDSQDISSQAALIWRITQRLSSSLSLEHYSRNSELAGFDYAENRVWLKLRLGQQYVPGVGAFNTQ
jgi:Putative beta-barrel porin 2